DLGPVVDKVKTRLIGQGFSLASNIPELHPTYTLVTSPKIAKARNYYDAFLVLRWLIPVLVLVLLAAGVALAHRRWHALMWGGIGIALAMGAAGAITYLVRGQIQTGQAVYDAFVASLHGIMRVVFLSAVVL